MFYVRACARSIRKGKLWRLQNKKRQKNVFLGARKRLANARGLRRLKPI